MLANKVLFRLSPFVLQMCFLGCGAPTETPPPNDEATTYEPAHGNDVRANSSHEAGSNTPQPPDAANETDRTAGEATAQTEMEGTDVDSALAPESSKVDPPKFEKLWTVDADEYDYSKCFAAHGESFVMAASSISLWRFGGTELQDDLETLNELFDFNTEINAIVFSPEGTLVAFGDNNGWIHIWDIKQSEVAAEIEAHTDGVTGLAFSPDSRHLASTGYDKEVRVWDALNGEQVDVFPVNNDGRMLRGVAWSSDGKHLAACASVATVWTVSDKSVIGQFDDGIGADIASVAFSPDGKQLAVGEMGQRVRIWDLATGKTTAELSGHEGPINRMTFSPDGRLLATSSWDGTVRVWDVGGQAEVHKVELSTAENTDESIGIAWNGKTLALAAESGRVELWGPEGTELGFAATTPQPTALANAGSFHTESLEAESLEAEQPVDAFVVDGLADVESTLEQPIESAARDQREFNQTDRRDADLIPAHLVDAIRVLDLRRLPYPPGTDGANDNPTELYYNGEGPAPAEALKFYDKYFSNWKDVTKPDRRGDRREFEKDGYRVEMSAFTGPRGLTLIIRHQGNFEIRRLPLPPGAKNVSGDGDNFAFRWIISDLGKTDLEKFYQEHMKSQGWHLAKRFTPSDEVIMEFIKRGIRLSVRLCSAARYPGKTMAQTHVRMMKSELPIPADAEEVSFNDSDAELKLTTPTDVNDVRRFYEQKMRDFGWEAVPGDSELSTTSATMRFRRGTEIATVSLNAAGDGTVVEASAFQPPSDAVLAVSARETVRAKRRTRQEDQDMMAALKHAMPVAEFPLPPKSENVFRNEHGSRSGGDIRFDTSLPIDRQLDFYRLTLTPKGWKENKSETFQQDGFGQLVFRKETAVIKVHSSTHHDENSKSKFHSMIEGSGLLAENDLRHNARFQRDLANDTQSEQEGREEAMAIGAVEAAVDISAMEEMAAGLAEVAKLAGVSPPPSYKAWLTKKGYKHDAKHIQEYSKVIEKFVADVTGQLGQ